jgi:Ca-activated chloride channel family protein
MLTFLWPWFALVLPLAWGIRRLLKPAPRMSRTMGAIRVPFWDRLNQSGSGKQATENSAFSKFLTIMAWVFLVLSAMRPIWWGEPIANQQSSHNIMLALDVSGSMEEQDFDINRQPVTRLQMLKALSDQFIKSRQGDHLGLVIFGSEAYTYAPLSPDITTLRELLGEVGIGIAGTQTAIGEALALAVQGVASVPTDSQIVILMSDGASNAGRVSVDEAIKLAVGQGIKVYTIGIGSDAKMIQDFFGLIQINPSQNLDEETLLGIAQKTGGRYFRAKSTQELAEIYNLINQLEPVERESEWIRPRKELFYIPLMVAMLLLLLAQRRMK